MILGHEHVPAAAQPVVIAAALEINEFDDNTAAVAEFLAAIVPGRSLTFRMGGAWRPKEVLTSQRHRTGGSDEHLERCCWVGLVTATP